MTLTQPLPDVAYKTLISPGPLIIVRLPLRGRPGKRRYPMRWRDIAKAAGDVMRAHGLRAKDLSAIDHIVSAEDWDPDPDDFYAQRDAALIPEHRDTAIRVDAAFDGDPERFRKFWLYDWRDGTFVLVREPSEQE